MASSKTLSELLYPPPLSLSSNKWRFLISHFSFTKKVKNSANHRLPSWRNTPHQPRQNRDRPQFYKQADLLKSNDFRLFCISEFRHSHRLLSVAEAPKCDAAPISFLPKKIKNFSKKFQNFGKNRNVSHTLYMYD